MSKKVIYSLLLLLLSCSLMAQETPDKRDSINSAILKEKRYFQVVLPKGYDGDIEGENRDITGGYGGLDHLVPQTRDQ